MRKSTTLSSLEELLGKNIVRMFSISGNCTRRAAERKRGDVVEHKKWGRKTTQDKGIKRIMKENRIGKNGHPS